MERTRALLAVAAIGFALALMLYQQVRWLGPQHAYSGATFGARALGIHFPPITDSSMGRLDSERNWQPRVLSMLAGSFAVRHALVENGFEREAFGEGVGLYAAFWLALMSALYLVFVPRSALLAMLATYAAVAFGYLPGIADRVFPWDLPALAFFVLFVCLLIRRRVELFLFALPVGVLFKETVGILCLAYLFVDGSRSRRLRLFGAALALALVPRAIAGWATTGSLSGGAPNLRLFVANVRFLLTGTFPHPEWYRWIGGPIHAVFVDTGLLLGFILHPYRDANTPMLRLLVLAFTLGILGSGIVLEYRIWFELIPLCLYPYLQRTEALAPAEASAVHMPR